MSWRRAGRWAAALVLLFACNQAPKHEERPGMVYILAEPEGATHGHAARGARGRVLPLRRGATATIRYNHPPDFALYFLGFRCAQDP